MATEEVEVDGVEPDEGAPEEGEPDGLAASEDAVTDELSNGNGEPSTEMPQFDMRESGRTAAISGMRFVRGSCQYV